jgi:prevent-host-death family protein
MRIAPVAEVKAKLSAFLKASRSGPVVVTRNGRAVAVLLSVNSDDEVEDIVLANSAKFQTILAKSRDQIARGEGVPHEQFWAEMDEGRRPSRSKAKASRRTSPKALPLSRILRDKAEK